jgi:hypothetical protein
LYSHLDSVFITVRLVFHRLSPPFWFSCCLALLALIYVLICMSSSGGMVRASGAYLFPGSIVATLFPHCCGSSISPLPIHYPASINSSNVSDMTRLKGRLALPIVLVATLLQTIVARLINTTIYDTNLGHVTYEPKEDFCARWKNPWGFWRTCEVWAQPWRSEVYRGEGRFATVHSSLNHELPSVAIQFEGTE